MKWRRWICKLLSVLRMHDPDCQHCYALRACWDTDLKKRLDYLQ